MGHSTRGQTNSHGSPLRFVWIRAYSIYLAVFQNPVSLTRLGETVKTFFKMHLFPFSDIVDQLHIHLSSQQYALIHYRVVVTLKPNPEGIGYHNNIKCSHVNYYNVRHMPLTAFFFIVSIFSLLLFQF